MADSVASREFYEGLGLTFRQEQHGAGPEHLSTVVGRVVFELYPAGADLLTRVLRIGLAVADLASVVERCGPAVVDDRERAGHRVVVVQDPDGHKIELTQVS